LRYPGGKGGLAKLFSTILKLNNLVGCQYYEPFAGGAGLALRLLFDNLVSELFLNDADPYIYAFWVSALKEAERFAARILGVPLNIEEWRFQQSIFLNPSAHPVFDVGFATFYLNRCNRSGILASAGPIGGYLQNGKWRLNARFNRDNLAARILKLERYRDGIHIYNLDAIDFLKSHLGGVHNKQEPFIYLDPPYYSAGRRLYFNYYKERDHKALAAFILKQRYFKWIMTYDDTIFIRQLYNSCNKHLLSLHYSLQSKTKAWEILISPHYVLVPDKSMLTSAKINMRYIKI